MHSDFITDRQLALHLESVQVRWDELKTTSYLQDKTERVKKALDVGAMERLFDVASKAKTRPQRVVWLYRAADVLARAVEAAQAAPCKKGCDSCCHMAVLVSRSEAEHLAEVSGRALSKDPVGAIRLDATLAESIRNEGHTKAIEESWHHHTRVACPFLHEGACSVWASRPLACRYHYSLDRDNLLCRLIESGESVDVPKLNTVASTALSLAIQGVNQDAADIRDWFA